MQSSLGNRSYGKIKKKSGTVENAEFSLSVDPSKLESLELIWKVILEC
jgi:hypothetical protein